MTRKTRILKLVLAALCGLPTLGAAQTGTAEEPVRYIGGEITNPNQHDGGLRYAVGVENIQVLRANRTNPHYAENFGWTYNHAPDLTYWNGTFYLHYLSNPVNEHEAPGHTLIATSKDGRNWEQPVELFPPYEAPEGVKIPEGYKGYMMHQRMGFYTALNGKLLTLAFYGHTEDPFKEGGIGRVVREIKKDGSFGPVYFIRYTSHADYNETNTSYPFYKTSKDKAFVAACDELLNNKLKTLQWLDEDRGLDGFYTLKDSVNTVQALSYYHRKDGKVVGLWKKSFATLSDDDGLTWSSPRVMPSLIMAGGKNWGQRTKDGRYAMSYNPIETQEYRYPLIVTSSEDGISFDDMGVVHGEVPPRRFYGRWKDFGPNYMRGLSEGEATPPDDAMWLTYSVNKEDIWISRIPLPIRVKAEGAVSDDFNTIEAGAPVPEWNIYAPVWAKAGVADFPGSSNKVLRLEDEDPYDYARAIRVFEEKGAAEISFKIYAEQDSDGLLQFDVTDRHGNRAICLEFDGKGKIRFFDGTAYRELTSYKAKEWYEIKLSASVAFPGKSTISVNGKEVVSEAPFAVAVKSLERLSFRTGEYRDLPNRKTPNQRPHEPLTGADQPVRKATFYIDEVKVNP